MLIITISLAELDSRLCEPGFSLSEFRPLLLLSENITNDGIGETYELVPQQVTRQLQQHEDRAAYSTAVP